MHIFFGPFPITYTEIADEDTLVYLTDIMKSVPNSARRPFQYVNDEEFEQEDKIFLSKIMKLDPRDRPSAMQLLEDDWLLVKEVM